MHTIKEQSLRLHTNMAPHYVVKTAKSITIRIGPPCLQLTEYLDGYVAVNNAFGFTPDGRHFLINSQKGFIMLSTENYEEEHVFENAHPIELLYSPKGTYFGWWGTYDTSPTEKSVNDNLHLCQIGGDITSPQYITMFNCKNKKNWQINWSSDEVIAARLVNNDVVFFERNDFSKVVHRIKGKVADFSIAPGDAPYHILTYKCCSKGLPAVYKLYQYPKFSEEDVICTKSLFQADKIDILWNGTGTCALVVALTEVDRTGASYYGRQTLYFITIDGVSKMINFSKEGPIHRISWSPTTTEFCVIYGHLPSTAELYNLKCEIIFEFPPSAKNEIYFNPHGNLLLLAGLGNINGTIDIWDVDKRKMIKSVYAPNTNFLEWSPDGIHFITAVTSPRLRTDNRLKMWHHSGTLLHEDKFDLLDGLFIIKWQAFLDNRYAKPVIKYFRGGGIDNSEVRPCAEAYRPPHFQLRPTVNPVAEKVASKASLKMRKKREAKKIKKRNVEKENDDVDFETGPSKPFLAFLPELNPDKKLNSVTGDPEKDKKIKQIKKKLSAIKNLKEQQCAGKTLEVNQLAKINTESELIKELDQLMLNG